MINVYDSKLCMATLIFYTCIYIPLSQIKQAIFSIVGFILCLHPHGPHPFECSEQPIMVDPLETGLIDLPMSQYGELKMNTCDNDEACSVCLVEFESEDYVTKLSKCGHIFHMVCIEKWVDRNQFTCPLCRSSFLNMHGSNSHATCNSMFSCFSS